MYPDLFGIDDFSYTLCMILGIIALCWGLIVTVACIACIGTSAGILDSLGVFD